MRSAHQATAARLMWSQTTRSTAFSYLLYGLTPSANKTEPSSPFAALLCCCLEPSGAAIKSCSPLHRGLHDFENMQEDPYCTICWGPWSYVQERFLGATVAPRSVSASALEDASAKEIPEFRDVTFEGPQSPRSTRKVASKQTGVCKQSSSQARIPSIAK